MRVDLEIDDGVVQFAGQLAHFLVEATVPGLAELLDQLHRLLEVSPFETVHQFARMFFQGRFEFVARGIVTKHHDTLLAGFSR